MLFAFRNKLFVYTWRDNLLGINNYIDQYIEHNNIECVQQALVSWSTLCMYLHTHISRAGRIKSSVEQESIVIPCYIPSDPRFQSPITSEQSKENWCQGTNFLQHQILYIIFSDLQHFLEQNIFYIIFPTFKNYKENESRRQNCNQKKSENGYGLKKIFYCKKII